MFSIQFRQAVSIAAVCIGLCWRIAVAGDPAPAHWDARIAEYAPDGDVSNHTQLVPRIAIKGPLDRVPIKITPALGEKHTFHMSADPSLDVTCSRIGRSGDKDIYRVVISSRTGERDQVKTIELGEHRVLLWQRGASRLIIEPAKPKEEVERDLELAKRGDLPPPAVPNAALVTYGRNGHWKSVACFGAHEAKSESKSGPVHISLTATFSSRVGTTIARDGKPPLEVHCERWGRKGNKDIYRFEFSSDWRSPSEKKFIELGDKPVLILNEPDNRLMLEPTPPRDGPKQ